ncbi:hypothetical protein H2199_005756 [Coniosporium tulheliwenetii]|uniref:Uncharacterized protein n=1 Tax=Coniosporium tulheliwenetii TaxID=3383036 RepID=A0ACC2Z0C3_9PEZI|nr:hypothetical protein H2199_005756 [Cladosporium sp. JES 115]
MAASDYVKHYDSTWKDLMKKQDRFPLQEYADRSVLTTWTISYKQVQSQSEEAASLLKLWGFLDCEDLELEFSDALQLLSHYSLVDAKEETSSHSMQSVLHEWCCQLAEGRERKTLSRLAAGIVARMVPGESEPEYWKLRRRLLPHGSRVCRWVDDERLKQSHGANDWTLPPWIFYSLGMLFAHQDKLDEAEKMYQRALAGFEKALGAEHTSTLNTVNNLGLLYAAQGKLGEAETMYQRALKGREKALGPEHTSTLDSIHCLGLLYAKQGKLQDSRALYTRALMGFQTALGYNHTKCQVVRQAIAALDISRSMIGGSASSPVKALRDEDIRDDLCRGPDAMKAVSHSQGTSATSTTQSTMVPMSTFAALIDGENGSRSNTVRRKRSSNSIKVPLPSSKRKAK